MTREEIQKTLAAIKLIYPSLIVVSATIDLWLSLLKDEQYIDVEGAVMKYFTQANNFPPTPGHIIQLINDKTRISIAAIEAEWDAVQSAAYPYKSKLDLSHTAFLTGRQLGWTRINEATPKDIGFLRKEFHELYKANSEKIKHEVLELRGQEMGTLPDTNNERAIEEGPKKKALQSMLNDLAGSKGFEV